MIPHERVVHPSLQDREITAPNATIALPGISAPLQRLLAPAAAAWLGYVAFAVLLQSPAFRAYDAGLLPYTRFLRGAASAFAPDVLLNATRGTLGATWLMPVSLVVIGVVLASWCWAVRAARNVDAVPLRIILALTAILATPLLLSAGLFSDDVYLYNAYGRMIAVHGANPILTLPSQFPADPHLPWVHWKELPSSYGPVWLMLSGLLSALAGNSLTGVVVAYRLAALMIHLATAAALWSLLHRVRPREALVGTVFYAWNPLVLVEVVGNAHNDVLVALFTVLLAAAAMQRSSTRAATLAACAVMVKPFAVLLLPPLVIRIARQNGWRGLTKPLVACALAVVALSLPFWSGAALAVNVMNNPAAHMYTNTLWELVSEGGRWFRWTTEMIQHPYLDRVRTAAFAAGALWIVVRRRSRSRPWRTALELWLLFYLTASWVWPWYFVPAVALAPLAGRYGAASATALTIGGLLFWRAWPAPTPWLMDWLFTFRSLLLFGPLLATLASSRVRSMLLTALGANHEAKPPDRIALRTAA